VAAENRPGHGYPRPLLRRPGWTCLNGAWDFAFDRDAAWTHPRQVVWDRSITVPFAPESEASGVRDTGFHQAFWYRRIIEHPPLGDGERVMIHFGAVDYAASVWFDGCQVGSHEGGYTPFSIDVTDLLTRAQHELVVRALDNPQDLEQPRGKQDWELESHLIWYPRTSGIWQTVWLERLPRVWISQLRFTPNLDRWEIGGQIVLQGRLNETLHLQMRLSVGDTVIADDTYLIVGSEIHRRIALADPGIDDSRNHLLWSPSSPTLIDVLLKVVDANGNIIDEVESYTALREIAVQGDRVILNGRPYFLRMVLDQGYWPETGLTAPDDDALRRDVELAKAMGFNGVRKHQKIEDPRYLYWADQLGLLVWEEMPSAYRFTTRSVRRLERQWEEVLARDQSHPCIAAWVPFNESWGVPNLPNSEAERHYVQALYHLTKTLDPTRPVVGNDGWESVATDIIGIHDYDADPTRIARRYHTSDVRLRLFQHERPAGRLLLLGEQAPADHPIVLSEFGGLAVSAALTWGYSTSESVEELQERYTLLLWVVSGLEMLAGICYTQFADTYQEANGLLYADRQPKFPLSETADATRALSQPEMWKTGWELRGRTQ
jgi:beta-galactosidase/beta-glucuronidase